MRIRRDELDEPDINVAALIDMVFLLLVYFMATASLVRSEADLGIRLPGLLKQARAVEMPDEQMIEVRETGRVLLNSREFDAPGSSALPELVAMLIRYRQAAEAAGNEALITIGADDGARHQRVIDVMNACARAGIEQVTFSMGGE